MFDELFSSYWEDHNFCLTDKERRTRDLVLYMLDRAQQIFVWENLPDTIPQYNLEYLLQTCGNVCITDVTDVPDGRGNTGLYAFFGGLGGMLNAYYEPTIYTIANPYLEFNKELEIGVDCVRARNDLNGVGFMPLFVKYCAMLNENEISMNMLAICYRIDNLISADNDRTYESAKQYFKDIVEGKFGAISSNEFFEGIRNDKTSTSNRKITDLIEYEQYIKASMFNEIGLNSNYNMKRERIVSSEAQLNDDALIPLIDNMLAWRLKACDDIRELYGDKYDLDGLTVKLNAIWDLDKMYVDMMPETVNEDSPEPDPVNEDSPEPDPVNEDSPEPDPVNEDSPEPDPVNEDSPEPDPVNEDSPEPDPVNEDSPEPDDININININTGENENVD